LGVTIGVDATVFSCGKPSPLLLSACIEGNSLGLFSRVQQAMYYLAESESFEEK
jgi:hypothetical protein